MPEQCTRDSKGTLCGRQHKKGICRRDAHSQAVSKHPCVGNCPRHASPSTTKSKHWLSSLGTIGATDDRCHSQIKSESSSWQSCSTSDRAAQTQATRSSRRQENRRWIDVGLCQQQCGGGTDFRMWHRFSVGPESAQIGTKSTCLVRGFGRPPALSGHLRWLSIPKLGSTLLGGSDLVQLLATVAS
jgi:hypothetical protein